MSWEQEVSARRTVQAHSLYNQIIIFYISGGVINFYLSAGMGRHPLHGTFSTPLLMKCEVDGFHHQSGKLMTAMNLHARAHTTCIITTSTA
jgi:hypothetical protein